MKCKNCNSCIRIVRVDSENVSILTRFCDVCLNAYYISGVTEIPRNSDLYQTVKAKYEYLYRGGVIL